MTIPVTQTPEKYLEVLRDVEADPDVTDIEPRLLSELRIAKMIYTAEEEGRIYAHLKPNGREALQRN